MAEQETAPGAGESQAPEGTQQQASPETEARLLVHRHYVKDLSFENPNAPAIYTSRETPSIKVQIDVNATRLGERLFEVTLGTKVNANIEDKTVFHIELDFAGVAKVGDKVEEAHIEPILSVEVPHLLFPFARNIVADVTRDGGYPPLLINPVDFAALRQQKHAEAQQAAAGEAAQAGSA